VFVAMLHDETMGEVSVDGDRPKIRYALTDGDARALHAGMKGVAQLLFAAGAKQVLVPFARPLALDRPDQIDQILAHRYRPLDPLLAAVHPMGTLPLGQVVDERGAWRGVDHLWVADGSLFPTSIGGPPQLTIYAAAHKVAGHLIDKLGHA